MQRNAQNLTEEQARAIVEKRIEQYAANSVAESTLAQYTSLINSMTRNSDEMGPIPATHHGISRYLSLPTTKITARTAEALRSAVNYIHEVTATPKSIEEVERADRVLTAYKRLNPRDGPEKGAIGLEQILQVVGMLRAEKYPDSTMIHGFLMQFAFGLRPSQVATLGHAQFSLLANGNYLYLGDRVKVKIKDTADTGTSREMHHCDPRMRADVHAILAKYANGIRDKPMFPNYGKAKERNDILKRAAKKYGWDPDVNWSGAHCVRHGALMEAREMGGLEEVERRGAHRTVTMQEAYSRTMEERRAPVRRSRSAKEVTRRVLIYPRETIKSPWPEGL